MAEWKIVLFIVFGINVGFILTEEGCNKPGIYPGNNKREFIICSPGGVDGKQLVRSKQTCPINSVYKDHKCVPTSIVPYAGIVSADDKDITKPDDKGNTDKGNKADEINMPCRSPGLLCKTCNQLSICIGDEGINGATTTYHELFMMTCPADQICSPGKGCVPNNNGNFCPYRPFECSDQGNYPDPYDCTVYYTCETINGGLKKTELKCRDGSYNSATNTCGYPMSTSSCLTTPVPLCTDIFQTGPVPDNLSKYYVCVPDDNDHTLAPILFQCEGGKKFDILTLQCS